MAEVAGFAISVVSLAGLVTNCIDCFKYVRLGRSFSIDFPIYQTELDVLELRFSRWAQAVTELSDKENLAIPDNLIPLIEKILRHIATLFQRAREDAQNFATREEEQGGVQNIEEFPVLNSLHQKLGRIVRGRQDVICAQSTVRRFEQVKWAIYKRDEFISLLAKVRTKVEDLESLISVSELEESLHRMRLEDASSLKHDRNHPEQAEWLQESSKIIDPILMNAIQKATTDHFYAGTTASNNSTVNMGDSVTKGYQGPFLNTHHSYLNTAILGEAKVSMGNMYGKTIFDSD